MDAGGLMIALVWGMGVCGMLWWSIREMLVRTNCTHALPKLLILSHVAVGVLMVVGVTFSIGNPVVVADLIQRGGFSVKLGIVLFICWLLISALLGVLLEIRWLRERAKGSRDDRAVQDD